MPHHTTNDGCRLAFAIAGPEAAPAVVLSNALGTDRRLWDYQIEALAERFRVLTYDTRGHGDSDAPAGAYSVERLGRDALSLMDAAGFARAHVCGVSIGGVTALWMGVHAPDRVCRLVLANTAARIGSLEFWNERMRLARSEGLSALADATIARWFSPVFRQSAPETIARMRATLLRVPVTGYLGCCAALRDADRPRVASQVRAPTLVVTGTHDVATPPAAGQWLTEAIPGARLVELDAAHLANVERAPEFTAALLAFLAA